MTPFDAFIRVVASMMARFGTDATLTVSAIGGAYDQTTSEFIPSAITNYPVRVIFLDLLLTKDGLRTLPNTLIQEGDKRVYIQPISNGLPLPIIQPNKDLLKIGTTTFSIVTLKEINTTTTDQVLIELYVRH